MVPVFDQGDTGSCVMNAICSAACYVVWKNTGKVEIFSRLFGYAMGRLLEGVPLTEDSGLYIPDGFRALRKDGLCYESTWPYGHGSDRFFLLPTAQAVAEAESHQGLFWYRCSGSSSIKASLAQGWPVVFGTSVPTDLEDGGEFCLPGRGAGFDGGHAMLLRGWSDRKVMKDGTIGAFRLRNSWGEGWRADDCPEGDGWISYALFDRGYATDAITLRGLEIPEESRP